MANGRVIPSRHSVRMAINLFDALQKELSDDAIGRVASFLGETPANTRAGLDYTIPAVVGTLVRKVQATQGVEDVFGILQRGGFHRTTFGNIPDVLKTGALVVASLYGQDRASLTDWISSCTGIRPQSSALLLTFAAPLVLTVMNREAEATDGFNASSIATLLGEQSRLLRSVAPAGLTTMLELNAPPA
jgi:hypothetical protein